MAGSIRLAAGVALAAMLLAACSGVVSYKPWFSAADTAGAPRLRDGVWRFSSVQDKQPCAVNEALPVKAWPTCAHAIAIAGARMTALNDDEPKNKSDRLTFLVAAGAPPIIQIEARPPLGAKPAKPAQIYFYVWLRGDKADAQGRATTVHGWRVLCGPPARPDATQTFYPGIADAKGDCLAASRAALEAAATATETDDPGDRYQAHWVRDGSR